MLERGCKKYTHMDDDELSFDDAVAVGQCLILLLNASSSGKRSVEHNLISVRAMHKFFPHLLASNRPHKSVKLSSEEMDYSNSTDKAEERRPAEKQLQRRWQAKKKSMYFERGSKD
jgi:hypothetical protein